jgi:hypothetical protein
MSPTGIAAVILTALVLDYMSVGPDSIRDRVAFLMALPAIRDGWDGSPLDRWTVQQLEKLIQAGLDSSGSTKLAAASAQMILGILIATLAVYCVGVLLPTAASSRLGQFAHLSFHRSSATLAAGVAKAGGIVAQAKYRLNWQLWVCAMLLGMMADLPGGVVGNVLRSVINALAVVVGGIPSVLFGVS